MAGTDNPGRTGLLDKGLNPAGPRSSLQSLPMDQYQSGRQWWELYDLPGRSASHDLPAGTLLDLRNFLRRQLSADIADSLFDRAARDFESLGLGWVVPAAALDRTPISSLDIQTATELVSSSLRILGLCIGTRTSITRVMPGRGSSENTSTLLRRGTTATQEDSVNLCERC